MRISFRPCRCILLVLTAAVIYACERQMPIEDTTVEDTIGGEEEEEPLNADVISSAVLTFAYYDIVGEVDVENRRVDFDMEVYGTDPVNLRYLPVTFTLKDGFVTQGTEYEYIRLILTPEDQPAKSHSQMEMPRSSMKCIWILKLRKLRLHLFSSSVE